MQLQACDWRLSPSEALIGTIDDRRQSDKVRYAIGKLLRQRLNAIGCGYPRGTDTGRQKVDPIQRLLAGRDPLRDDPLTLQSTLSRPENAATRADPYRMGIALAETMIKQHLRLLKCKGKRITIDLSPTGAAIHGARPLAFFNGYYDT